MRDGRVGRVGKAWPACESHTRPQAAIRGTVAETLRTARHTIMNWLIVSSRVNLPIKIVILIC